MKVYDASNQIVGRLSSHIAKELLKGENIFVVNVEKSVLAGNPKKKKEFYLQRIHRGDPIHGPFFPKQPDEIFRRAVRGMLPWDKNKGREAFRRLKVFIGVPEDFKGKSMEKLKSADAEKLRTKYMSLEELSLYLGAKKRW